MIHLAALVSFPGIRRYFDNHGVDLFDFATEDQAAWLWFRLREIPDDPEVFTSGKWSSIQRLEGMLQSAAESWVTQQSKPNPEPKEPRP